MRQLLINLLPPSVLLMNLHRLISSHRSCVIYLLISRLFFKESYLHLLFMSTVEAAPGSTANHRFG